MAKADVKAAYRTMPVQFMDWHLQGIKWHGQYFIDTMMSFGNRASVDQWLRFSSALSYATSRWGIWNVTYIDDFIFVEGSKADAGEATRRFNVVCTSWDVVLKAQGDAAPAQAMVALGISYDLMVRRPVRPHRRTLHLYPLKCREQRPPWPPANRRRRYSSRRPRLATGLHQRPTRSRLNMARGLHHQNGNAQTRHSHGDAGSEWGMGGFDAHSFFYAPWQEHMWQAVQRTRSTSSLHMEALQVLVAARVLGPTWRGLNVIMRLDCLVLVQTMKTGYHQHAPLNAILQGLAQLQITHDLTLEPVWVRRCWDEAADALSKNDLPRFWANVDDDRSLIGLTPDHLAPPLCHALPTRRAGNASVTRRAPPVSPNKLYAEPPHTGSARHRTVPTQACHTTTAAHQPPPAGAPHHATHQASPAGAPQPNALIQANLPALPRHLGEPTAHGARAAPEQHQRSRSSTNKVTYASDHLHHGSSSPQVPSDPGMKMSESADQRCTCTRFPPGLPPAS